MDHESGEKIDWLSGQNFLRPEDPQFISYLQGLEHQGVDIDHIAPFLLKEFRKGTIRDYDGEGDYRHGYTGRQIGYDIPNWSEWLRSRAFNRPQVGNIMDPNFTLNHLTNKVDEWHNHFGNPDIYAYEIGDLPRVEEQRDEFDKSRHVERARPADYQDSDPNVYHDWPSLVASLVDPYYEPDYEPHRGSTLYDYASKYGHIPELGQAYQTWRDNQMHNWEYEPDHEYYNEAYPEPSREEHPDEDEYNAAYERWEQERGESAARDEQEAFEAWPQGAAMNHMDSMLDPHMVRQPNGGGYTYVNEPPQPGQQQQVVASFAPRPRYYRWVYKPHDASVELDHNADEHPAYVRTHRDLATDAGAHPVHGYAYRIHGGWRLTDYRHQPVEDPFVVAQVIQKLRGADPQRPNASGPDWITTQPNFDALHYGSPIEESAILEDCD